VIEHETEAAEEAEELPPEGRPSCRATRGIRISSDHVPWLRPNAAVLEGLLPFRDGLAEATETIEIEILPGDGYAPVLATQAAIDLLDAD
jgi:hypothetical protein